ncbi:aminotransferase-like domain-containing protein [Psychromonas sp. CD1]|uniref:aminotransferase-like domain-containing protein n=1 Tax=Psychromonas sp. CD1 TaxID=1979839 RepID=UPI000B9A37EB|nr:PLP-dependent aminotransferase family protein [Psychromonas sp. CD1]
MSVMKFKQIASIIEERIQSGFYAETTRLPTHRALAREFSSTPVTIAKAYKCLAERQQVESFVGRGTFVCSATKFEVVIQADQQKTQFNFSIIQPCLAYNVQKISEASQKVFASLTAEALSYSADTGTSSHRQAALLWAQKYALKGASAEQILLTSGVQNALDILIRTYTQAGDCIAIESLTYPGILSIAYLHKLNVIEVSGDEKGMLPEALRSVLIKHQPKLVIIVPSQHNPTAFTMPNKRRLEIAKVIKNSQTFLIEDDIYGFLNTRYIGAISNSIPQQSFYLSGISKAISPALRCAFIKVPTQQLQKVYAAIRSSIWQASPLNFSIFSALIYSGEAFEMAEKQRDIAHSRQLFTRRIFSLNLQENTTAFHLWLKLPRKWSAAKFILQANKKNILVSSGDHFSAHQQHSQYIRLALMGIDNEMQFQQGIYALKKILDNPPLT